MWTDNETTIDLLGFKVHADLIRSVVTDKNLIPVVIGVFGDWGGGKSSIMRMLQESFESKKEHENVVCLYFNGWMFEGYEDAKTALLSSILIQLGEHKKFGAKIKAGSAKLLKKVNWMNAAKTTLSMTLKYGPAIYSLFSGDLSQHLVPSVPLLPPSAEPLPAKESPEEDSDGSASEKDEKVDWNKLLKEDKSQPEILVVRKFREDFEKLLKDTKIESLVILIDDLDRCLPERIIETLEAIKLFVLVPQTAFVIGADQRIVEHAIGTRYVRQYAEKNETDKLDVEKLTKDYLEKLVQIPYNLPRLSPTEIETYINLLACQKFLDKDQSNKVLEDWSSRRKGNFYSAYQYSTVCELFGEENVVDELKQQLLWSNSIAQVLTEGLKGNPRQVKRMLNKMILRKKLAEVAEIDIDDAILAKLMVLEYVDEDHFKDLNTWQTIENGKPRKLTKLEDNILEEEDAEKITEDDDLKDWLTGSLKKWVEMKPSLKNVDLRDYFWLARDRTNSTLSGVNMAPTFVKRLFEKIIAGNTGEINLALKDIKKFSEMELTALFGLLKEQLERHPNELSGFSAITRLAREKISGAGAIFFGIIKNLPASEIPAGVAERIIQVGDSDENLKSDSQNTLKHFADKFSGTKFGKACKAALEE